MGKLPMDLMAPIPEVVEQENCMKEALTKPDSSTFDKKKKVKLAPEIIPPEPAPAEIPKSDSAVAPAKKKKPRGVSAMSPTSRAAHMKKMREASARSRKAKAEAKKNAKTNEPAPPPTTRQPTPPPTPLVAAPSRGSAPLPATPAIPIPTPVANPIQHQYAPIDYDKLAEVMERRAKPKTREVTAEQLNYFERTIRSQERDKTLADIEKEQEKKIQDFMNKRTKRRGMPKVGEATTRYSDAWGGRK